MLTNRDKLIVENMGLVYACAKRFCGRGEEYEDLCATGFVGLVKAADKFDACLGFRFSTYAVPVILGEIKRMFRDGGTLKVSRSLKELAMKIHHTAEEFESRVGRDATMSELSELMDEPVSKICEALSASRLPLSLSYYGEDDESTQIDVAVDSGETTLTEKITLHTLVSQLESPDKEIIDLRYFKEKTQSQTATELGMTQVQISRREKKILLNLRQKMTG